MKEYIVAQASLMYGKAIANFKRIVIQKVRSDFKEAFALTTQYRPVSTESFLQPTRANQGVCCQNQETDEGRTALPILGERVKTYTFWKTKTNTDFLASVCMCGENRAKKDVSW